MGRELTDIRTTFGSLQHPQLGEIPGAFWPPEGGRFVLAEHRGDVVVSEVSAYIGEDGTLRFASSLFLIPVFGYVAAAAASVASEACSVLLALYLARTRAAFRPRLVYVPVLAAATAVMAVIVLLFPGPGLWQTSSAALATSVC